ncbi:epithelial-stromal interaction protein 1 [Limanda limanda]|uniref:epithelial-stromal interaction protein 1 n=1 Tax=Limanda limanda TaxID=27771 RepID=UPI0029C739C2|nr:epithelial-stromal interaction protein 1 [Limanda limanda]
MDPSRPPGPPRPPQLNSRNNRLTEREEETSANSQTSGNAQINAADPPAADRQPQYSTGFTMIPPNLTRRSEMQTVAQKGEETLQRMKEARRVHNVSVVPAALGGSATLDEVRQKQQSQLSSSKVKKRVEKGEMDRKKRQDEEEELQKKKDEARKKAERHEEREREEEQRRREQLHQDHLRTNGSFLQRIDRGGTRDPPASSGVSHTSSRIAAAASQNSGRDLHLEHKRVNSAFLDDLQGRGVGSQGERAGVPGAEWYGSASKDLKDEPSTSTGQQAAPPTHLKPDPDQSWTQEADQYPDYDWALLKLGNIFPNYDKDVLRDVLHQVHGDFEQAVTMLVCTLT